MDKKNVSVPLSSVPNRFQPVEGVVKRERDDLNENLRCTESIEDFDRHVM